MYGHGRSHIQVSTRCILIRDGLLLVQRGKRGHLRLPGGRLTDTETVTQCLKREMLEELALEVRVGPLRYIVESFYENKGKIVHEIGFYFECSGDGEPRPQERHIEIAWVEIREESLARLRPRILASVLPLDWRRGWSGTPRYLVSFDEDNAL